MNAPVRPAEMTTVPVQAGAALRVSGLVKAFGDNAVLRGLDFTAQAGAATALIGANGSGKSTTLKCLIRLIEPDAGRIEVFGRDVAALGTRDLRRFRSQVGMVWQKHNLVPRVSALSNVLHGALGRVHGPAAWFQATAPATLRDEAMTCLARVGLADKALQRVDSLSGGQQQRVAIARTLMQRAGLILADEPDASLDPQSGEEVMRLLADLARVDGLTVVFISHRMEHTLAFSDRILGLQKGRLVMDKATTTTDAAELRRFFEE
ncbi:MAG: ABC transporter [Rhodobacteraceae bacterium PARR1]|nr:MAG: ABC transporter [Rhodobacteraceae bacterium PARR1]